MAWIHGMQNKGLAAYSGADGEISQVLCFSLSTHLSLTLIFAFDFSIAQAYYISHGKVEYVHLLPIKGT